MPKKIYTLQGYCIITNEVASGSDAYISTFFAVVGVPAMKLKKSSYSGSRRWVLAPTAETNTSRLLLFKNTLHNMLPWLVYPNTQFDILTDLVEQKCLALHQPHSINYKKNAGTKVPAFLKRK